MTDSLRVEGTKEQALRNTRRLLAGDPASAESQARIVIEGDQDCIDAHSLLGIALRRQGRLAEARDMEQRAVDLSMLDPTLFEALVTLSLQQLDKCERTAQRFLREHPENAAAMRLVAEVAARTGKFEEAENLLNGALSIAPDYGRASALQARIRRMRETRANRKVGPFRSTIEWLDDPGDSPLDEALQVYRNLTELHPSNAEIWVSYGHLFRTIGEQDTAVDRYRKAIEVRPTCGEAWCAIGDLKASRFTQHDVKDLKRLASTPDVADTDGAQLYFGLARALEQFGDYSSSFEAYSEGNRLRSGTSNYDPAAISRHVERSVALFTSEYFAERRTAGEPSPDTIFVLGLPRSGSTLIEQILSSHSRIEPTGELSDIPNLAGSLAEGSNAAFQDSPYPESVGRLPIGDLQRYGRGYLWNAGLRRKTNKPLFIDKMPNNWLHTGFILSILPNAKIIDARRHPVACSFSNFRQYFATGQEFTYDLAHVAQFYRDYVRMMAHFDRVVPGRVHRVIHESLVAEPESEIRRMLNFLGIPFEDSCLRFYENKRAVRTASSEQVRRPINSEGVDQWRNFEPWLGELKQALGSVVDAYPDVPADLT
jgi:tetratricopeptide (TPR) repeat protein